MTHRATAKEIRRLKQQLGVTPHAYRPKARWRAPLRRFVARIWGGKATALVWCIFGIIAIAYVFGDRLSAIPGMVLFLGIETLTDRSIHIIDGDTLGFIDGRPDARLVGFNAPETADAQCNSERRLGERAKQRLRELIGEGPVNLQYVRCSCRAGTEGTNACNYGRDCARLRANGRDVGDVLISEGLAERYVCGASSCPRRRSWCG